jgi:TonB-dependent SusC/RagA subfamily outer membrane receptor
MQIFNSWHPAIKCPFMYKLIFAMFFTLSIANQGMSQAWDRHMEVKKMNISINSDAFTATTFIEMEFYNPTSTEMEGLYTFQLEPGQAITAFQLDLFGKYRDGSIEEKWKATNAYNTIVGKKVDPALLTMSYDNNYQLRIYPVPAKASRKVTMTIQQLLIVEKGKMVYKLPLNIKDVIDTMNVKIEAKSNGGFPSVIRGLLEAEVFNAHGNNYSLSKSFGSVKAEKPISFSIPLSMQQHSLCIKQADSATYFALRLQPGINRTYRIKPQQATIFWDVSVSGSRRDIGREIDFLKKYVAANNIKQLTIVSFNQRVKDTAIFYTGNNFNSRWMEYLHSFSYEGATQFGVLDLSSTRADAILLFSDGKNSFGSAFPVPGKTHVYAINSAAYPDPLHLEKIIGQTGGRYIDLTRDSYETALEKAVSAENVLLSLAAGEKKIHFDQRMEDLKGEVLLLTGRLPLSEKMLTLSYGNNGKVQETETIGINAANMCAGSAIDRIQMLTVFDKYVNSNYWMSSLEFGKHEKVVTPNTAYIVLEKVEDYIKFNITPPKELESQCDMNIFVRANEQRRQQYKKLSELEIITNVAVAYNERLSTWEKEQGLIVITKENAEDKFEKGKDATIASATNGGVKTVAIRDMEGDDKGVMGTEVVVTAMGQTRQPRELGYSVSKVWAEELTAGKAVNLQNGLTGKVSGLNVTTTNSGVFGDTRITLRGIRSLSGNNQPMLILDGVPISLSYISSINPNDIANVTILKSASSTAIYGPDGANGALVITTKKGNRNGRYSYYWGNYRLKNQEDVDYLAELKEAGHRDKLSRYEELKKIHGDGAGFYFDAAQHLFEKGHTDKAKEILFSAAEITGGDKDVLRAMGYMFESWKEFGEAILIYQQLRAMDTMNLQAFRDLALAFYQQGNYQEAVSTLYKGILGNYDQAEFYRRGTKAMMLQEMNAIIAIHRDKLDLTGIHKQLVKPLTVDMRIVLDCNSGQRYNSMSVVEPGGEICNAINKQANGRITREQLYQYYSHYVELHEYQVKQAKPGRYRIKLSYSDQGRYHNAMRIPTMVRITTFKNFGKADQRLEIENVIMDNQNGNIEIAEVKW